ncbi:hypothetical protein U9M48_009121 [Paspalum notatum var. saurae]|uniref:Uncharacterized protein n=1 Tax=Paspalum notatum var. saurae TaxID=547442 RepID=A0AAQ3SRN7_PASNO
MPSILHAAAAPSFLSTRGNSRTSITFPRYPQAAMGFSLSPIASSKEAARASSSMGAPLLLQASSTPPRPRRAMPCNFPDVAAPRRSDFPRQFPSAWGFLLGVDARVPAFQAAGAAPHRSSSSRRSFARHDFPLITNVDAHKVLEKSDLWNNSEPEGEVSWLGDASSRRQLVPASTSPLLRPSVSISTLPSVMPAFEPMNLMLVMFGGGRRRAFSYAHACPAFVPHLFCRARFPRAVTICHGAHAVDIIV